MNPNSGLFFPTSGTEPVLLAVSSSKSIDLTTDDGPAYCYRTINGCKKGMRRSRLWILAVLRQLPSALPIPSGFICRIRVRECRWFRIRPHIETPIPSLSSRLQFLAPVGTRMASTDAAVSRREEELRKVTSLVANIPSVSGSRTLKNQAMESFARFFSAFDSKGGATSAASTNSSLEDCALQSAILIRDTAAQNDKLKTRQKLQQAASLLLLSPSSECGHSMYDGSSVVFVPPTLGSKLATSLVMATLAITATAGNRIPSRAAASAISSVMMDPTYNTMLLEPLDKDKSASHHLSIWEELIFELVRFSDSFDNPRSLLTSRLLVDMHIVTMIARSLHVAYCPTPQFATATSNAVRQALDMDSIDSDSSISTTAAAENESVDIAAGLALAAQLQPWTVLSPVSLVEVAVSRNQWHGAERICQAATLDRKTVFNNKENVTSGILAVHALIDAALVSRSYRRADAFATAFFEVGGQSRFLNARFLHACDTISKVIQKNAFPVIEKQVERVDKAVTKIVASGKNDLSDDADDGYSAALDGAGTSVEKASYDIRTFAIEKLEECLNIDAAQRLASMWNMEYSYDEKAMKLALATRRQKYLQWDELLPERNIPDLLSTASALENAFVGIGEHAVYGFDVEWGDNDSGAALLQISTLNNVFLVDIPALSESPEGSEMLERFIGRLFSSSNCVLVGFGCSQDVAKLRSSPCSNKDHWLGDTRAVVDLQSMLNKTHGRIGLGLSRSCEIFLSKPLDKAEQCSDWQQRPLNERQRMYASLDAYVCALIYAKQFSADPSVLQYSNTTVPNTTC